MCQRWFGMFLPLAGFYCSSTEAEVVSVSQWLQCRMCLQKAFFAGGLKYYAMAGKSQAFQSVFQLVLDQVASSSEGQAAPETVWQDWPRGEYPSQWCPIIFHKQKEVKSNSRYLWQEKDTNKLNSGSRMWEVTGRRVYRELVCEGNSTVTKASTKTAGRWEAQPLQPSISSMTGRPLESG